MTLSLEESAARCGAHCWVERRLFEVLGGWGASAGAARVVLLLDRHSQHAAWRAGQWWERLPVRADLDREALVRPPDGWEAALGPAGEHRPAPDGDAALLAVTHRVLLPRLVARYRDHADHAGPVADGPVLRTLAHAVGDGRADWEEGEVALQAALTDREAWAAAWAAATDAEAAFLFGYREAP